MFHMDCTLLTSLKTHRHHMIKTILAEAAFHDITESYLNGAVRIFLSEQSFIYCLSNQTILFYAFMTFKRISERLIFTKKNIFCEDENYTN